MSSIQSQAINPQLVEVKTPASTVESVKTSSWDTFQTLATSNKILTVVAGVFLSIFTLGVGAYCLLPRLITHLKQEELEKAQIAKKVDEVAKPVLQTKTEDIIPENTTFEAPDSQNAELNLDETAKTEDHPKAKNRRKRKQKNLANMPVTVKTAAQIEPVKPKEMTPEEFEKHSINLISMFWEDANQKGFLDAYEKIAHSRELNLQYLDAIIDVFCAYRRKGKPLGPKFKAALENNIIGFLDVSNSLPKDAIIYPYRISDTQVLERLLPTEGDGSCGFHALIGTEKGGKYRCNAAAERKRFCDRIRAYRTKNNKLPVGIERVIVNIYEGQESLFYKNVLKDLGIEVNPDDPILSSIELQAKYATKEAFINDDQVFEAYIKNLEKVGTYLNQEELILAALFYKKRINLYQRGWYNDSDVIRGRTFNEKATDEVSVYFTGSSRHYERIEVKNVPLTQPTQAA